MSAASTVAAGRQAKIGPRAARVSVAIASRPLWLALVLTALITAVRLTGTVDSDVAWQLWIAQRIDAGARLYTDIIEINPPLWFWMALPIDRVAALLHVRSDAVLIVAIGGLVAMSLAATDHLIADIQAPRRALFLGYAALILMAMPWMHLGQREQIALIGTLSYALLTAARRERKTVSTFLAVSIGVGAALGFALKHYFLIVPAMLELWLIADGWRRWRPLRPETLAMVTVGLAYFAAILLFAPIFLTDIVPLIRLAYGAMGAPSFYHLFGPYALVGLVMLGFTAGQARLMPARKASRTVGLLIAALAFAAVYFIQSKGWLYHAIPLLGCASLGLAARLAESGEPGRVLRIVSPALLAIPLLLAAEDAANETLPGPELTGAVSGLRPGDTVGFLAVETAVPWSITLQHGLRYPSRYMGYWMMPAIVRNERLGSPNARLTALGREVVSETVTDFRCTPPRRIVVTRPRAGEAGFDILAFFLRDPQFASLLSHYRVRSRAGLETFEQVSPLPKPSAACRRGV